MEGGTTITYEDSHNEEELVDESVFQIAIDGSSNHIKVASNIKERRPQ